MARSVWLQTARWLIVLSLFFLASFVVRQAFAGGGPTTTLVVVNDDSPTSLYVGTRYAKMREISPTLICRLRDIPNRRTITIEQFRERIWSPIAAYLKENGLESTVDCIAYSTDFPFGVKFDGDFKEPRKGQVPRVASLNSLTFLARRVMEKDTNYTGDRVNKYCRTQGGSVYPSHGFRSGFEWTREKEPNYTPELDSEPLDRYWLSTLLGFSGLQGNTTKEILSYLDTGLRVDGRAPNGTVYLMENKDVRAKTRMPMFEQAVAELSKRKRRVEVVRQGEKKEDGRVPRERDDILGLVGGIASFDWSKYESEMAPGAIAEHLTSFGGRLDGSGQTKLTAFLRAGAVGSSGTVAEPLALWWKFPTPFLHAHYADGCSLAEAFYQSVSGPYQLLIVGDPLARPFAEFLAVGIAQPSGKDPLRGTVAIQPTSEGIDGVLQFEIFLNGRLIGAVAPQEELSLDTTTLDDGHHELRAVGVGRGPIRTRSMSDPLFVRVANAGHTVTLKPPRKSVMFGQEIKLSGRCKGKPTTIEVLHGTHALATVTPKANVWKATISSTDLGRGDHLLVARAAYAEGPAVRSVPQSVTITKAVSPAGKKKSRRKRKPKKDKGRGRRAGLQAAVTDANGRNHSLAVTWLGRQGKNQFIRQIRNKVKGKLSRIVLSGEMRVAEEGTFQFAFNATGGLKVKLHNKTVFEDREMAFDKQRYAEVFLTPGWHPIEIAYAVKGNGDLSVELGGAQVTQVLSGNALSH